MLPVHELIDGLVQFFCFGCRFAFLRFSTVFVIKIVVVQVPKIQLRRFFSLGAITTD